MKKKRSRWRKPRVIAGMGLVAILGVGVAMGLRAQDAGRNQPDSATAPRKTDDNVRIILQTIPARKAIVKWGNKTLGMIPAPKPLVVQRPRDSGPLDLVIRASGYLPVHTRAYTFSNNRVAVKLTPLAEKNTLFGYREEVPPGGSPDGGVAPPAAAQPPPAPAVAPTPVQGLPLPQP